MSHNAFYDQKRKEQINWRQKNISTNQHGFHSKNQYPHLIPKKLWSETIWQRIRPDLLNYITSFHIQYHPSTHNLLSSWVLCANIYFPVRTIPELKQMMLDFLNSKLNSRAYSITSVELEFALPEPLDPSSLLGEEDGKRGSGQTSPDIAFEVQTDEGKALILTECKYTEHSFYICSALRTYEITKRIGNPDPKRCFDSNFVLSCHQNVWGRKYWSHLPLSPYGQQTLKTCPAARGGYQLLRQHSLAAAIAKTNRYSFVASCVAFDGDNSQLQNCMGRIGINWQHDWENFFSTNVLFKHWTHQEWVNFVRQNNKSKALDDWLNYVNQRYGY